MSYQREFEKRIRVAVVGAGSHSYRNIFPTLHYLPVELVAVCDINEEAAALCAKEYGCKHYTSTKKMYENEKLEAVFFCVSPYMHAELACEAFDAGLHAWIEKPPSTHAVNVEEMIKRRKDNIAVVGFKKVFMPSTEKAVEIVASPKYGNLISVLAIYPMSIPENGQEVLDKNLFTNWLGNSCHPLSFMMHVCGNVEAVTTFRNKTSGGEGGLLMIEFKNGVIGNFHFASGPHPSESFNLYGDTWHMNIDNSLRVTLQRGIPFEYGKTTSYTPEGDDSGAIVWEPQNCLATLENKALFTQGLYSEMKYFCDCILNQHPAEKGSLEFALEVMKVYEAALVSKGNRIVIK